MTYRPSTGRKIEVKSYVRDVRAMLRRHLREEGKRINPELAQAWNMHPNSAYRRMYDKRPYTPQMIDAAADMLSLDEFDRAELHRQAAREFGFRIDGPTLEGR